MQRKGQAALEFLSTYGFAFLIILVMIGALSYFGVLNPKNLIPNRCTISAEFQCFETQFITGTPADGMTLNVVLINQIGNSVSFDAAAGIAKTQFGNSGACSFTPDAGVLGGESSIMSCEFAADADSDYPAEGEKVKASISFQYTELGRTYPVTVSGEVLQTLQGP